MKFKLDENLGERGRILLEGSGHDVETVATQALSAAIDDMVFQVCAVEDRALVTLDLDFANPLRFAPTDSPGIAVLRLPRSSMPEDLQELVRVLIAALEAGEVLAGHLWIVEKNRIRVYQPPD